MTETLYIPLYKEEKAAEPSTVLVTGATGFVAGPIVQRLLAAGHTVHATVRDPSNKSAAALKALPGAAERLKFFTADLLQPGAFDEAMKGCRYVLHTASPFFTPDDLNDVKPKLLEPAVNGTTNVLEAVNACETVERVVLTSSCAAIWTPNKAPGERCDESDWSDTTSETNNPYAYSKKLAEQKAWEIANAQSRWKLVTINPSYVMGPPLGDRLDGESIDIISKLFKGGYSDTPDRTFGIVDCRDVAAAHCLAMVHPNASGRYIVSEGSYNVAQLCHYIHEKYPYVQVPPVALVAKEPSFKNEKIQKELGFKFHDGKTCILDMVTKLVDIGRITPP